MHRQQFGLIQASNISRAVNIFVSPDRLVRPHPPALVPSGAASIERTGGNEGTCAVLDLTSKRDAGRRFEDPKLSADNRQPGENREISQPPLVSF